ncbi:hypothetical protein Tco_0852966 [Tanacetum coccineum]
MKRFENAIFKQREEINDKMTKMFGLLKELTTNRAPEKVLTREEAKFLVTKNVNSISLTRWEEEKSKKTDVTTGEDIEKPTKTKTEMPVKEAQREDEAENEPNRKDGKEETTKAPSSQPIEYYLKHRINEKLIEGLVDNHRKKITRKEDTRGNFEILFYTGGLKHMNALLDQGSDVNVMPLSTYMKLTDERPTEIVEDILVEVSEHVYPIDFVILDIKKLLIEKEEDFFTIPRDSVGIKPDGVTSPAM